MRTFETRRVVPHTGDHMFELVADVENYPKFVPLCKALVVRERTESGERTTLIADMTVAFKLFQETFCSRVVLDHARRRIAVDYLDGPFRQLENRWSFMPVDDRHCEVDFFLSYELRSRSLQVLVGAVFDRAFAKFADAFEKRADLVYGRPPSETGFRPFQKAQGGQV